MGPYRAPALRLVHGPRWQRSREAVARAGVTRRLEHTRDCACTISYAVGLPAGLVAREDEGVR